MLWLLQKDFQMDQIKVDVQPTPESMHADILASKHPDVEVNVRLIHFVILRNHRPGRLPCDVCLPLGIHYLLFRIPETKLRGYAWSCLQDKIRCDVLERRLLQKEGCGEHDLVCGAKTSIRIRYCFLLLINRPPSVPMRCAQHDPSWILRVCSANDWQFQ